MCIFALSRTTIDLGRGQGFIRGEFSLEHVVELGPGESSIDVLPREKPGTSIVASTETLFPRANGRETTADVFRLDQPYFLKTDL